MTPTAILTTLDETTLRVEIGGITADIAVPDSDRALAVATEHYAEKGVTVNVH